MNIAYSILSAVPTIASSAGTAEAASADKWTYILNPAQSAETVEAGADQALGAIDRLQSLTETATETVAQRQIADPDYWSSVGMITLAGIVIVFAILALLIFLFWLLGTIFKNIDSNKKAKAEEAKKSAPAPAPAAQEIIAAEEIADDDDEVIAVIAAAIAAYSAEDGKAYKIKEIRRRDPDSRSRSAWSLAGIGENTRPF